MTTKKIISKSSNKKSFSEKNKFLFGGSVASDLVNQLTSITQCQSLPENVLNVLNKDFIISNYGASYKTTGGGKNNQKKKSLTRVSSIEL